mmetsp:Transcript_15962/g.42266  ORF Transcript_15962/g.42266 Transcript_15962/m.42266 type:complete len:354 (+) Transcript_15962:508-1569(+)
MPRCQRVLLVKPLRLRGLQEVHQCRAQQRLHQGLVLRTFSPVPRLPGLHHLSRGEQSRLLRLRPDCRHDRPLHARRQAAVQVPPRQRRGLRDLHDRPLEGRQDSLRCDDHVCRVHHRREQHGRLQLVLHHRVRPPERGLRSRQVVQCVRAPGKRRPLRRAPGRHHQPGHGFLEPRASLLVAHEGRRCVGRAQRHDHRVRLHDARAFGHGGQPRRAQGPPRRRHRRRVGRFRPHPLQGRLRRRHRGAAQRGRVLLAQGGAQQDAPHEGDAPRGRRQELDEAAEGRGRGIQGLVVVRPVQDNGWAGDGSEHPGHRPQSKGEGGGVRRWAHSDAAGGAENLLGALEPVFPEGHVQP